MISQYIQATFVPMDQTHKLTMCYKKISFADSKKQVIYTHIITLPILKEYNLLLLHILIQSELQGIKLKSGNINNHLNF
jgi:hypothetical protein